MMVDWTYCRTCGTVVDEFENICSNCKLEITHGGWGKCEEAMPGEHNEDE